MQAVSLHIHRLGSTTNHTVRSLYGILIMTPVSWGVMEIGTIAPRVGIKPTFLLLWATVLTITSPRLPDITMLHTPTCLFGSMPDRSMLTTIYIIYIAMYYKSPSTWPLTKQRVVYLYNHGCHSDDADYVVFMTRIFRSTTL